MQRRSKLWASDLGRRQVCEFGLIAGSSFLVRVGNSTLSKALDEVHTCAVCIGEHTPTGWFKEEIERALNRQTRTQSFRVIPVILPGGSTAAVDGFLQSRTWVDFSAGINDGRAFHYLMCGVRGVAPGRYEEPHVAVDDQLGVLRDKLQSIRKFRQEHLIDPEIAIEYQRRVLDVLFNQ